MAFNFNIFKKKPFDPSTWLRAQGKQEEAKKAPVKESEVAIKKTIRKSVGVSALSLPHITEKAGLLRGQNQYVFKVVPGATKYGVRHSVQAQYGVEVEKVRMITVPSKSIRVGRRMGERPGYKKAMVTLKEGHKIETGV